jgi:uncharacterized oxidoreductase
MLSIDPIAHAPIDSGHAPTRFALIQQASRATIFETSKPTGIAQGNIAMSTNWKNLTVLVTGGTSGIGLAFAKSLAIMGAEVGLTGRDPDRLRQARASTGAAWTQVGDLSRGADRETLLATIRQRLSRLDLLINNAGLMLQPDLLDGGASLDRLEEEISLNLIAPIVLSVGLMPLLRESRQGAIIMISSGYALAPADRAPTYSASKAGLHAFTKSLRRIAGPAGVRVLEVLPPLVDTPSTTSTYGRKLSAETVVQLSLKGLEKGTTEVLPGQARFLPALLRWLPRSTERMIAKN